MESRGVHLASERGQAGRPRDVALDVEIRAATVELLTERGYNGLSIKAVAERAGTTTPTIYRRWASKSELVLSAVFRTEGDDIVADSGDLEADVATMIRWTLEKLANPVGRAALAGLLGEPDGGDLARLHQLVGVWRRVGERLRRALAAGELRSALDLDVHIAALAGPAMMMAIVHGERGITDERIASLTSIALDGIRAKPTKRPSTRTRPSTSKRPSATTRASTRR